MEFKGSKSEANIKAAFAGEAQANRRYSWFARRADIEGYPDTADVFRSTASGEGGHAEGHLEYMRKLGIGDPVNGLPTGTTTDNLKTAIASETFTYTDMYPGMAKTARDEGFAELADWFEVLARAEKSHCQRFKRALDELG
ncbi:MAG: rubrerythrin family protein [Rhodospirillales bacterium]|nr:rubrerythrin [Rhodospirillaceae bacterium]MDP6428632.1 rubrerythrin family protein [Rhodospirillales bacterium]MDP6645045.1 rubrerythrin family protein [Rhodospirillales bacterium]MDP6842259.1 rubrerythrin family protein [Rhodospirillales bacterium]